MAQSAYGVIEIQTGQINCENSHGSGLISRRKLQMKFVMNNSDNDMPRYDNGQCTPSFRVLTNTYANQVITVLFADLQVLVTGSLHLVGDVLTLLKRSYKLKTVPSANNTDNPKHSFAHLPNIRFSYHIVEAAQVLKASFVCNIMTIACYNL